jgi:signal transduction histidine kinase
MSQEDPINTAKQALEQSVYQAVMEHAPWPMVEVEGSAHLVRSMNPAFCRLLKKEPGDLLDRPLAELVPQDKSILPLLDRVSLSGQAEAHVEAEQGMQPVLWSYTCWPLQVGSARRVGLMIQIGESGAFREQSTNINEALLISSVKQHELTHVAEQLNRQLTKEIAERKQAEDLLRRNHDSFFALVEHAPFGIYVVDARFRLQQMNSTTRKVFQQVEHPFGRDFEEVLRALWPEPFATRTAERFRHTLHTGEAYSSLITEQRKDLNALESYDWKIERVTLPDGTDGVVCYFYDVSEHMKSEALLREADRRKSEFLATLAHELRNPLAPMRSGLELLALADHDSLMRNEAYGMMQRQMSQMVRLIDDLMDLSRITRGVVELRMARVDLRTIIEQAVETCRPFIDMQEHTLALHMPGRPVMIHGDSARLTQVFTNLLNNSAKYSDRGGSIAVRLEVGADAVSVAVEDNGIGIAPDQVGKVFDMFAQVARTNERVQGGLGIGLNIVKHLVGMHGGRITVHSDGVGHGSSFTVLLPLSPPPPVREASATSKATAPTVIAPHRILVVDDNEDAALMQSLLLRKQGHEVRVAHNGEQALELGAQFAPDVVLMDLGMPIMDGYAACRMMRRMDWGATALIVALSGWGQDEDRVRSREAGFDHHLVKPIASAELTSVISAAKGV